MRLLGRYKGQFGAIDIVERLDDGARLYLEEGIYQSQATGDGELPFAYVRLMAGILSQATNVLLLGCGGGTLATMMVRDGKGVTVVDRNPISFQIAERFFGMPPGVTCVCADFRDFALAGQNDPNKVPSTMTAASARAAPTIATITMSK